MYCIYPAILNRKRLLTMIKAFEKKLCMYLKTLSPDVPPLFITVPVPQVSSAVYTTSTVSGHAYVCLGYWFDFGTGLKV
jgi:hypothetical protein